MRWLIFLLVFCSSAWSKDACLDEAVFLGMDKSINIISNNIEDEVFLMNYFSSFSELEKKIIFINLDAYSRSKLWLAHLNKRLDEGGFNKFQYEIFLEIISFASHYKNFELNDSAYSGEKIQYLYNKINKYFTREDAIRYFGGIASSPKVSDDSHSVQSLHCACNRTIDFCYIYGPCDASSCASSSVGCGLLWLGSCNGRCSHMAEP